MTEKIKDYFKNLTIYDILYIVGFLLILIVYFYKVPLEIQGDDESFYLMMPKRLTDGDIFIVDEWHGSQFAGFLSYPFMALHRMILGTDSIVLHFRFFYVFLQSVSALVIYFRLREYKLFGVFAALFFYIFTPYDITSPSYNALGVMLVAVSGTLLGTAKSKKSLFAGGFLYAGAVLCCPYLAVAYLIYSIGALIYALKKHDKTICGKWLAATIGIAVMAALFVVLMLSRASITEIKNAIPDLFTDPEHQSKQLLPTIISYFQVIQNHFFYGSVLFTIYLVIVAEALIDKKRCEHKIFYILVASAISSLMTASCLPTVILYKYNSIMFPLSLVGLVSFLVTKNRNYKIFAFTFLGGIIYSMVIHFSSNQHIYAITMASTAANVGSIAMLGIALSELDRKKPVHKYFCAVMILMILVQLGLMTDVKIYHKFASHSKNSELTQTIQTGPYKGIKVTPATEQIYMSDYETLKLLMNKEGKVLYATDIIWFYLATPELKTGAYSGWLSGYNDSTISRLNLYYGKYPDKLPDYIYIPNRHRWNIELFKKEILDRYGFKLISNDGAMIYGR